MTKPNRDFELFQREFKKWQRLFGLGGYEIHFKYEPDDASFASIAVDQDEMTATVRLNSKLPDKDKPHKDIKRDAKHEALHLLTARINYLARCRYTTGDEIYEAIEELVHKLEGLIP